MGFVHLIRKLIGLHYHVKWKLNAEGEVVNHEIFQSVINTTERMTYQM